MPIGRLAGSVFVYRLNKPTNVCTNGYYRNQLTWIRWIHNERLSLDTNFNPRIETTSYHTASILCYMHISLALIVLCVATRLVLSVSVLYVSILCLYCAVELQGWHRKRLPHWCHTCELWGLRIRRGRLYTARLVQCEFSSSLLNRIQPIFLCRPCHQVTPENDWCPAAYNVISTPPGTSHLWGVMA